LALLAVVALDPLGMPLPSVLKLDAQFLIMGSPFLKHCGK